MKKLTISSILVAAIASGMIFAVSNLTPSATAEYFYCNDRQTFSAFDNIIVPAGQTCVLDQFNVVKGDIQVKEGATLVVCADNDIAGNVEANGAKSVELIDVLGGPCVGGFASASDIAGITSIETMGKVSKVTVCHKPGTSAEKEIEVPPSAVKAHLDHGDKLGKCGEPKALGLVVLGDINIQNTENFSLLGNPVGKSIVRGDISVSNTQTLMIGLIDEINGNVDVNNVKDVVTFGNSIEGSLGITVSGSCYLADNTISGNTEANGCSNLGS